MILLASQAYISIDNLEKHLTLSGKHELLLTLFVRVSRSIEPSHGIIQNSIEFHIEETFSVVMFDLLSKVQRCRAFLFVIGDVACIDSSLSLALACSDGGLLDLEFIGIEDDFIIELR
jgi:hypothetical protein